MDPIEMAFRQLVDQAQSTVIDTNELEPLYVHFEIPVSNSLQRSVVTDHIYQRIADVLTPIGSSEVDLRRLRRQVVLRHLADGAPLEPYYGIVQVLQDAVKSLTVPFTQSAQWLSAIGWAKDVLLIEPRNSTFEVSMLVRMNPREGAAADAIKVLRAAGYKVTISEGRAFLTEAERTRIAQDIDRRVKELGAIDIADRAINSFRGSYDSAQERHHVIRNASMTLTPRLSAVPWAYILNLAAKYPRYIGESRDSEKRFAQLVCLAAAYATTFDVEPFNGFELMFHTGRGLPSFLSSIAVFDGMYTLVQQRPSDVLKILRGLFAWVIPTDAETSVGFTFQEAFAVIEAILSLCTNAGPVIVSEGTVATRAGLSLERTQLILAQFSHGKKGANANFLIASDQPNVDFWFRPLLLESPGEYLVMDRSWCAPAFYEALAQAARKVGGKDTENRIGVAFEKFVCTELTSHSIKFASGDYDVPDGHRECDIVVETANTIIFVELKKKVLTREARGGSDVAILLDLAQSMFDAQIQACRHELALYKVGAIELTDGTQIQRNERKVERVALGLLDFGGMHDRTVMMQILDTVIGFDLKAIRIEDEKKIQKVHERAVALREILGELEKYREQKPLFFNSWFLSLGQLLIVLDGVTGNEEFKKSLFASRHLAMGTLDFYFEHHNAKNLKPQQQK